MRKSWQFRRASIHCKRRKVHRKGAVWWERIWIILCRTLPENITGYVRSVSLNKHISVYDNIIILSYRTYLLSEVYWRSRESLSNQLVERQVQHGYLLHHLCHCIPKSELLERDISCQLILYFNNICVIFSSWTWYHCIATPNKVNVRTVYCSHNCILFG